jgi:hypothetical protein
LGLMGKLLRNSFHSRDPRFDLATWGEILGVMSLDTAYEPADTFERLGIDPSQYRSDRMLEPLIQQALLQ